MDGQSSAKIGATTMIALTFSRFAGIGVAAVWVCGLVMSAAAGAILPSDASYFWLGALGVLVGLLLIPIARAWVRDPVLRVTGVGIAIAMAATGTLLAAGSIGLLGQRAPAWLITAAGAPLLALFAWIAITTCCGLHRDDFSPTVLAFGVLNALALPIGIVSWIDPYTHTNDTLTVDSLMALVVLVAVPGWMIAMTVRVWRHERTEARGA